MTLTHLSEAKLRTLLRRIIPDPFTPPDEWAEKNIYASTTNDNEIYIQNVELAVGDKIIFKNTAKSLEQGYAQIKDDCPGAASFSAGSSNELTVKTGEAGTYDFYIDLSVTKGIWVVKHVPTVHKTVNISGPDWLYQADPDFFAHVWDGSSHYVDVLLTKTSDGVYDLAFAESWTPTNIKVYRCKPGASAPHFDGGDTEGKVWNQSNEVAWAASMSVTFA